MDAARPADPPRPGRSLRVVAAQLDLCVGDLDGNVDAMVVAYRRADALGADLVAFPELAICGYPPEDLLLKPGFIEESQRAMERLAAQIDGRAAAVVGWIEGARIAGADPHDPDDGPWNAAAMLHSGRVVGSYRKQTLPNYGVFDEKRYFDRGRPGQDLYRVGGVVVALTVCEDVWVADGPVASAVGSGAELVLNINASPFHRNKQVERERMLVERCGQVGRPIVYLNLVGGQDDLVFDGGSVAVGSDGVVIARAERFVPAELLVDVAVQDVPPERFGARVVDVSAAPTAAQRDGRGAAHDAGGSLSAEPAEPSGDSDPSDPSDLSGMAEVWQALVLGVRDYVAKNGFDQVVIGLSGGVDSSIVAAIAVDALGPDRVHGVLMPSRYSSDHSVDDAVALSTNLGIEHRTIPVEPAHSALLDMLAPSFAALEADLTEENLQSRIRGVLLMALSNKFSWLVLSTGNKSETAVGYTTLYGDTVGALAVIKDVPKLLVYELCRWRNARSDRPWIPESVIAKPPSAELRPDQRDDQSLPPYEVLDPLIEDYVDGDLTVAELVERGHEPGDVERITTLIDRAEYKRRQSPPGIRISEKSFGRDRRLPITNRY